MARGRMISNKICLNRDVNDLCDDTSRLAFTWLVTFADVEGRTHGDPAAVRSLVFPRRADITADQIAGYMLEWHNKGLIVWYEAEGDWWVWFPGFEENQHGLRKDREMPSAIPAPTDTVPGRGELPFEYVLNGGATPELLRSNAGVQAAQCNVMECNLSEGKERSAAQGADAPAPYVPPSKDASEEPPKKRPSRADPRTNHPAIQAVRSVLGGTRNPPKAIYDSLIRAVGDAPNMQLLSRCRTEWVERGYNANSYKWATEWYAQGGPNGQGQQPRAAPSKPIPDLLPPGEFVHPVTGEKMNGDRRKNASRPAAA